MNKKLIFMGMTALVLSFGLVFAGCEQDADDDDDSQSPTVPAELRHEWAKSATPGTKEFEFTSNYFIPEGMDIAIPASVSGTTSGTITLAIGDVSYGTAEYTISEEDPITLTLSEGTAYLASGNGDYVYYEEQ
jgi:hypothetical protein